MQQTNMNRGLADLMRAVVGLPMGMQGARADGYNLGMQGNAYRARAQESLASAALDRDRLAGRQAMTPETLAGVVQQAGFTGPGAAQGIAALARGSENFNMSQLGDFAVDNSTVTGRRAAMDSVNAAGVAPTVQAAMQAAIANGTQMPALQAEGGGVIYNRYDPNAAVNVTPVGKASAARDYATAGKEQALAGKAQQDMQHARAQTQKLQMEMAGTFPKGITDTQLKFFLLPEDQWQFDQFNQKKVPTVDEQMVKEYGAWRTLNIMENPDNPNFINHDIAIGLFLSDKRRKLVGDPVAMPAEPPEAGMYPGAPGGPRVPETRTYVPAVIDGMGADPLNMRGGGAAQNARGTR